MEGCTSLCQISLQSYLYSRASQPRFSFELPRVKADRIDLFPRKRGRLSLTSLKKRLSCSGGPRSARQRSSVSRLRDRHSRTAWVRPHVTRSLPPSRDQRDKRYVLAKTRPSVTNTCIVARRTTDPTATGNYPRRSSGERARVSIRVRIFTTDCRQSK